LTPERTGQAHPIVDPIVEVAIVEVAAQAAQAVAAVVTVNTAKPEEPIVAARHDQGSFKVTVSSPRVEFLAFT